MDHSLCFDWNFNRSSFGKSFKEEKEDDHCSLRPTIGS
jgi:hypothetical protein